MLKYIIIILCISYNVTIAQIGSWLDYLPYNNTTAITAAKNKIYAISNSGVFYYHTQDNTINKLSKITGLSDVEPSAIKFDSSNNTLLIGYSNGNIDLLVGETIINISDIKQKEGLGNKVINAIFFKDGLAYLSCGFGIVVLDIKKQEIKETYFIGDKGTTLNVNELTITPKYMYAATNSTIKRADLNSNNLADFNNWANVNLPPPGKVAGKYNTIASLGNKVYTNFHTISFDEDTMYFFNDSIWSYFRPNYYGDVNDINIINNKIYTAIEFKALVFDSSHTIVNDIYTYKKGGPNASEIIEDSKGDIWIADKRQGIVLATNMFNSTSYYPEGPEFSDVFNLEATDEALFVASGSINANFDNKYNKNGVFKYEGSWQSFNKSGIVALNDSIYMDVIDVSVSSKSSDVFYMATWGKGLFQFTDTNFIKYDTTNSILEGFNNTNQVKIGGTAFDKQGNLWVTNARSSKILAVKTPEDTWFSYGVNGDILKNAETVGDVIIDKNNFKWLTLGKTPGVLVFDDNNTLDNVFDDRSVVLNFPNSVKVFSVAEDLKGYLWFGTEEGIYVNYQSNTIFSNPLQPGNRIVVSDGVNAENLLENEKILDIAVDGANRKWMATENAGVFLISANGKEQIQHFTSSNSPLLSNNVLTLAINQKSGEVFFGTDKGVISYKGLATKTNKELSNVIVFPNPVPESYTGTIGVKGLVEDSNVKITDLGGTLVFEAEANGGQFVWNGLNFENKKVVSGVYLVFVTNMEGEKTMTTKILIK